MDKKDVSNFGVSPAGMVAAFELKLINLNIYWTRVKKSNNMGIGGKL